MKRLLIAITLLSLCICLSLFLSNRLEIELTSTKKTIEKISSLCLEEQYDKAFEESSLLLEGWSDQTLLNTTALKKENTQEIEKSINEIYVLLKKSDCENAVEICDSTVAEIDYLLHAEKINVENIF